MSTKYIRPNNLLSDRKTSELIKKKKYISEDEYEAKYAFIESLLSDLDLNIEDAESITEEELNQFKIAEKNINDNIEWLMGYIDEIFHNDKFDIDQKKAKIRNYITEKYNLYKFKNINRFIKQKIKEKYIDYENEEEVISDENNNFQYILKKVKNIDRNKIYDNLIYKITNNDSMSIEDDNNNLIISLNTDIIKEEHEINDFKNNNNIFFYNDKVGFKIVSLTETCSKISFRYKTKYSSYQYNIIYLYIDGECYDKYITGYNSSKTVSINVVRGEHEFTWVLYSDSGYYSCIDEIKINDLMVIEYGKFKNYNHNIPLGSIPDNNNSVYKSDPSIESTPFYNDKNGIKIVSLTETCSKMSFRYKTISTSGNTNYAYVYLYIDGEYHGCYYNSLWAKISDITLEQGRHEFTWVLYNYFYEYDNNTNYSCICIDEISIDDEIITNYNKFTNNSNYELINNNVNYKYSSSIESTPFYNLMNGVKIVSLTETCSKISFRYKTYNSYSYTENNIYFYIDGEYYNKYANSGDSSNWNSSGDITVEQGRHEFTWVLCNTNYSSENYHTCIDEISIDDEIITDYNKFNNKMINIDTYDRKNKVFLNNKNYTEYNNYKSVSFYHDKIGVKIVSLTETCSKISFRYQGYQSMMYLYIDGKYYDKYYGIPYYNSISELEWKSIDITVEQGRHEFTWVFSVFDTNDPVDHIFEWHEVTKYTTKFICIDEIAINDTIITDYSKFSNTNNNELINKIEYDNYKYNPSIESTPFYNDKNGIKIVSLTETCSKISFRYKSHGNDNIFYNCIYLYIDGEYYDKYNSNDIWSSTSITVEQGRHEFTWVLYSVDNIYYSCIDEIAIDDEIITDYSKFTNNSNCELINNKVDDIYKYDPTIDSTPFYSAASNGIKIVSLTETCSKMNFKYRTYKSSSYNNAIYLYIAGEYYNEYYNEYTSNDSWYSSGDIAVEQGRHEFTWVLYSDGYIDQNYFYYAYIDEITIDDEIITDYSKFTNNSNYELINNKVNDIYKYDPSIESTPFYNDKIGIKIVSLTETCSKMSFRYKNYSNDSCDNAIYLYIDGECKGTYCSNNWYSRDITIEQGRHEFTWVLYNAYTNYYSCIDEITIDDTLITNYDKFTNISNYDLNLFNYKYNPSIVSTPFYNDTEGIKIVSLTETCSKMNFRYKSYYRNYDYDNAIYLYIDGEYYHKYMSSIWSSSNDILIEQGEHEFTWILYDRYHFSYTCIDEITIDDEIITNYSKFTNNSNYELINNEVNNDYKYNPSIESTPFYNSTDGIKIVTLTETCSKISFMYKTEISSNKIFFYIDGEYKGKYTGFNNNIWYSSDNINVQQGEHKFTWLLCNSSSYFACIDEIAIDNVMITNYDKFNNNINYELPLASIPNNNNSSYKYNPSIDSTPFYNATSNIKIVSLIETCNKISFMYKARRNYSYIYFYIDGKICNFGRNYNNNDWYSSGNILVEQGRHEFTWVLYDGSIYEPCIDDIAIDGTIIIDYNKFTNNINYELINEFYKYRPTVESIPFYIDKIGVKIVSLTETCSKMSFKYKIYSNTNYVYLYIDGKYHSYYSNNDDNNWYSRDITIEQGRHEFTWVLYNSKSTYYSCIDEIAIDDVIITDYNKFSNTNNNELNNNYKYKYDSSTVSTPFYNSMEGIKIVSLTETCSKMSFRYKNNRNYNYESCIYLYIDGKYYGSYRSNNNVWTSTSITVKQGRHEFTWVLYSDSGYYSCIDEIAIDDVMITDYSKFSNNSNYELNNNSIYKYDLSIDSTPFYIDTIGIKKVSLTKTCSKMSFRYKAASSNNNDIYLYIDGKYYKTYTYIYNEPWSSSGDITVKQGRHNFTWILRTNGSSYYSCIDEIAIDGVIITDYNNFTNNSNYELINEFYKYDLSIESTPFYIDKIGVKIVSLTETCSKMSFRYKSYREGSLNYIYLYIDGKYYDKYYELYNGNSDWNSSGDITVEQGEHEFTWILCNNRNKPYDFYYSCIDEIAIDGVIITNYDKFTNISNHELINEIHKYNPSIESTLFYNDTIGVKIVSLTETCSKMSFRYRTNKNYIYNSSNECYNYIYLFIDGNYYDQYYNYSNNFNIWSSISIAVEQGEHEFTWVLCSDINDKNNHYSCIDEISIDDTLITNYDKFTNNSNYELNSLDNIYKDYYIYKYDNIKLFTMDFEYSGDIYLSINNKITHMKSLPKSIKEKYRIFDYRNEINSIKIYSKNKVNINEAFSLDHININIDPNEEIYDFISLNEKIKYNKIYKIDAKYINIKNINEDDVVDGDVEYICLNSNMNIIFSTPLPFILKDFINNKIEKDIIYLLIYSKNKNGYIDNNIEFEKINFVTRFISFSNNENKKMKLFNGDVYQKIKINNKNNLHNIIDYNIENIEL